MTDKPIRLFTLKEVADLRRTLRKAPTPAENYVWQKLKASQIDGLKFRRQHSYGPYVMDFYCPKLKLCIELDGEIHDTPETILHDDIRTEVLNNAGITVLRFSNQIALEHFDIVKECIIAFKQNPLLKTGLIKYQHIDNQRDTP